jgi:adenylate cyclase
LTDHVLGTRASLSLFGTEKGYAEVLLKFWVRDPLAGVLQAILLLVVWIHGCIGIHMWLRLRLFYPRVRETLLSIAVLLPALALLGYYQGGERTRQLVQDPIWRRATRGPSLLEPRPRTPLFSSTAMTRSWFLLRRWPS